MAYLDFGGAQGKPKQFSFRAPWKYQINLEHLSNLGKERQVR